MRNFGQAYYYENYRSLRQYGSNDQIDSVKLQEETKQMVLLFAHLKENIENGRDVVDYYKALAGKMELVSGADTVLIYGCSQLDNKNDVYEIARQTQQDKSDYENIVIRMCDNRGANESDMLQENIIIRKKIMSPLRLTAIVNGGNLNITNRQNAIIVIIFFASLNIAVCLKRANMKSCAACGIFLFSAIQ